MGSIQSLDGSLGLIRRRVGYESKSFASVVGISDCPTALKGRPEIILRGLLTDIVNKQLCTLDIISSSSTTTSSSTASAPAVTAVTTPLTLWSSDVHLNGSAGNFSVIHAFDTGICFFIGTEFNKSKATARVKKVSDLTILFYGSLEVKFSIITKSFLPAAKPSAQVSKSFFSFSLSSHHQIWE